MQNNNHADLFLYSLPHINIKDQEVEKIVIIYQSQAQNCTSEIKPNRL